MNKIQAVICAEFEMLERGIQMELLQREGIYIGKQALHSGTMLLYQYKTIYVEIQYSLHRSHIENVNCFTDTGILDKYLSS